MILPIQRERIVSVIPAASTHRLDVMPRARPARDHAAFGNGGMRQQRRFDFWPCYVVA